MRFLAHPTSECENCCWFWKPLLKGVGGQARDTEGLVIKEFDIKGHVRVVMEYLFMSTESKLLFQPFIDYQATKYLYPYKSPCFLVNSGLHTAVTELGITCSWHS